MNNDKSAVQKFPSIVSLVISSILLLLFINVFLDVIPLYDTIQGLPLILPAFIAPIGIIIGAIGYSNFKNRLGLFGLVSNIIMFLLPFVYMIGGTLIFGP